jgi:hypothetical protein
MRVREFPPVPCVGMVELFKYVLGVCLSENRQNTAFYFEVVRGLFRLVEEKVLSPKKTSLSHQNNNGSSGTRSPKRPQSGRLWTFFVAARL